MANESQRLDQNGQRQRLDNSRDQRPGWFSAIAWLLAPLTLILCVRWLLLEPYVIPSGSMIPSLLVHDHILVNKLRFGVRVPFGKHWIQKWDNPHRGDIVVFRYPENPEVFYVKRVLGLPGEKISVKAGVVHINGEPLQQEATAVPPNLITKSGADAEQAEGGWLEDGTENPNEFSYFTEPVAHIVKDGLVPPLHTVRYLSREDSEFDEAEIPPGSYFMMGDNRDQSNDSRSWGVVHEDFLIGTPMFIWLSCSQTLETARFLCDPSTMRWDRIFQKVR